MDEIFRSSNLNLCFVQKKLYRKSGFIGLFFFDEYYDYYFNSDININELCKLSTYYEEKISHTKEFSFSFVNNMICISLKKID